jgi:formate dehydrogenase major subunit
MYTLGDKAKNVKSTIIHVEGDPDHPVNRGTLCPKGAGVLDMIHSESRVKVPAVRAPGSDKWERISWDDALARIAKHMKADRDANFIKTNAAGTTVNRWNSTGLLLSSAASNETGFLSVKVARGLGMVALDTQARI